jgi:N-ethylmaleimide reductase
MSLLRESFGGSFIRAGGLDRSSAEHELTTQRADLMAFGRAFIANPDLVERLRANAALNTPDMATFYSPGARGYTDYPTMMLKPSLTSEERAA